MVRNAVHRASTITIQVISLPCHFQKTETSSGSESRQTVDLEFL